MKKIKVQSKFDKEKIVYFRFFSKDYPGGFWYTLTMENDGFDLGRIRDYEPINTTWENIQNEAEIR